MVVSSALLACSAPPPPPPSLVDAVATTSPFGREWKLVALGGAAAPIGAFGKPVTLQLDSAESRVAGFAGCNRYFGPVTIGKDSLQFGALASTKMACADGEELERNFLTTLPLIVTWQVVDSTLTLSGPGGPLVRFTAVP